MLLEHIYSSTRSIGPPLFGYISGPILFPPEHILLDLHSQVKGPQGPVHGTVTCCSDASPQLSSREMAQHSHFSDADGEVLPWFLKLSHRTVEPEYCSQLLISWWYGLCIFLTG